MYNPFAVHTTPLLDNFKILYYDMNKKYVVNTTKGEPMKEIFETIKNNPLFEGIAFHDFEKLFGCLSARTAHHRKDGIILLTGNKVTFVGLVLAGRVKIMKEDAKGSVSMLAMISAAGMFGDVLACAGIYQSPVTIIAAADTDILFFDNKKIFDACSAPCSPNERLIKNMLRLIAKKNFLLNRKIEILSKRTTREKLISFFDLQRAGAKKFTIPFTREEMAHYLCVDRSAMSTELCKMRDDGLIVFNKGTFELLYVSGEHGVYAGEG